MGVLWSAQQHGLAIPAGCLHGKAHGIAACQGVYDAQGELRGGPGKQQKNAVQHTARHQQQADIKNQGLPENGVADPGREWQIEYGCSVTDGGQKSKSENGRLLSNGTFLLFLCREQPGNSK